MKSLKSCIVLYSNRDTTGPPDQVRFVPDHPGARGRDETMSRTKTPKPACPYRAIAEAAKRIEFEAFELFVLAEKLTDEPQGLKQSLRVAMYQLRDASAAAFIAAEPEAAK